MRDDGAVTSTMEENGSDHLDETTSAGPEPMLSDARPAGPPPPADPVLAAAVDAARAAAVEVAGRSAVGDHLGCEGEPCEPGLGVASTHLFAAVLPGYTGWRWAVTVARADTDGVADDEVTIDEVVLLPGPDSVLAPEWVPWSRRLRPEDVNPGDLVPTDVDDERLAPAYLLSDDPAVEEVAFELGLGRVRVISLLGRLEAADRWEHGDFGPRTAMARHAPSPCGTCGFFLPLAGSLRAAFGGCGNSSSPADGRIVAVDYGCGAHSEAVPLVEPEPLAGPSYDTASYDLHEYDVLDGPAKPAEVEPAVENGG